MFQYDALNRLQKAQTTSTNATSHPHCWEEAYVYDNQPSGGGPWGNLTNITVPDTAYNNCLDSEGFNQSLSPLNNNQISGFGYDAAGNWTGPTGAGYAYDAENHLVAADGVAYTYDGDGERIEKSSGEMYWYTSGGEVLDETDLSGNLTSEYIFFGGARIARRDGSGNLFYYLADHLGSSREIIEAGATTPCYDADFYPFGGERKYTDNCPQNYKFTGKERDPESGLDDFSARFYGSWTGRFTSPDDPFVGWNLADPQSLNLYAYVQDNPINDVDPTGHMNPCKIIDGASTTSCGFDSEESAGLANILIEGVDSGISGGILTPGPDTDGIKANTAIQAAAHHNDTQTMKGNAQSNKKKENKKKENKKKPNPKKIPSRVVIMQDQTQNLGYFKWYFYQLQNSQGQALVGKNYTVGEFISGPGIDPDHTSNGEFSPVDDQGEVRDTVGLVNPPQPGDRGAWGLQSFGATYNGTWYPISTVFIHNTTVDNGAVTNTVTPIVP